MVVDSSVLIAILLGEQESEHFSKQLANTNDIYISAVSIVELSMVIEYKRGEQGAKDAGKMRAEGKEYVVKDGDVMNFLFSS